MTGNIPIKNIRLIYIPVCIYIYTGFKIYFDKISRQKEGISGERKTYGSTGYGFRCSGNRELFFLCFFSPDDKNLSRNSSFF